MSSEKYLTKEGFERLKKELERLKKEERIKVAQQLEEAISFGDLSENAAYDEAKEEQAILEGKIVEIENTINNAIIIKTPKDNGFIDIGSKVTIEGNNLENTFLIVGEEEASPIEKRISHKSPIGKALLGKKVGDKVKIQTPGGVTEYEVKVIS